MAVRNFWIEANVDGRKTSITGGPQAKDGGISIALNQRDKGAITTPIEIHQRATDAGMYLETKVYYKGVCILTHHTER